MSSHDSDKEIHELSCFQRVLGIAKERNNKTGELLRYFDGDTVNRTKQDSPDIVRLCIKGKKSPQRVVVGIEHFQVNQQSIKKGKKVLSTGLECEQHIREAYDEGHHALLESDELPDSCCEHLMDSVTKWITDSYAHNYDDFLFAFHKHLSHHLQKVDKYRRNVSALVPDTPVEIAFLIEIRTVFPTLYLNDGIHTPLKTSRVLPVCEKIVRELEHIDKKAVNYIILYSSRGLPYENDEGAFIVALETGNIRKHLKNQKIPIYHEFFADNSVYAHSPHAAYIKENNAYTITAKCNQSQELYDEQVRIQFDAIHKIYKATQKGHAFITTKSTQCLWDASKDYLHLANNDFITALKSSKHAADVLLRYNQFMNDKNYGATIQKITES